MRCRRSHASSPAKRSGFADFFQDFESFCFVKVKMDAATKSLYRLIVSVTVDLGNVTADMAEQNTRTIFRGHLKPDNHGLSVHIYSHANLPSIFSKRQKSA